MSSGNGESAENAEMTEEERLRQITEKIIAAPIKVHRALGPGLLESAYEACTAYELVHDGLRVEQQKALPLIYREVKLDCGYRCLSNDLRNTARTVLTVFAVDSFRFHAPSVSLQTSPSVFELSSRACL